MLLADDSNTHIINKNLDEFKLKAEGYLLN